MINSKGWAAEICEGIQDQFVTASLDALANALHVKTDDLLKNRRILRRAVPGTGTGPS
jgi:hypothetical protein